MWCSLFLLCAILLVCNGRVINTRFGSVKGAEFTAINGRLVHAFKHVPFAAAPTGQLRYTFSQPAKSWSGVRDATEYGPACPSNSTESSSPQKWVDEDCLHVNVFVSEKCLKASCPVVFYIHGGGLNYDSAVMFDDISLVNNFAANDVVLVITAFRLGFASQLLFSEEITPRNLALHDILDSLEWVQSNIDCFGGNPDDVTLFGHSYGAAIVLMFTLSRNIDPQQRLFHKSVAMSPQISFADELALCEMSRQFANRAGCMPANVSARISDHYQKEVVQCLRSKTGDELLKAQRLLEEEGFVPQKATFTPPLFKERNLDQLFRDPPKRPLLTGTTSKELDMAKRTSSVTTADLFGYINPIAVGLKYELDEREQVIAFNHTFQTQQFFMTTYSAVKALSRTGAKSYLYQYNYPHHPYHTDDLFYLMGVHRFEMDENEKHLSEIYRNYFVSFIKTGSPDRAWKPLDDGSDNYYDIDYNVTTDKTPHNNLYYQSDIISYWSQRMQRFDQTLTVKKAVHPLERVSVQRRSSFLETQKRTTPHSIYLTNCLMALFLVSIGFIFGRYFGSDRKCSERTMDEKSPLVASVFA